MVRLKVRQISGSALDLPTIPHNVFHNGLQENVKSRYMHLSLSLHACVCVCICACVSMSVSVFLCPCLRVRVLIFAIDVVCVH